jgi:hypothetical protein
MHTVKTGKLGLAAYIVMKGAKLTSITDKGVFILQSDKTLQEWEELYFQSCCKEHDTKVVEMRDLRHGRVATN